MSSQPSVTESSYRSRAESLYKYLQNPTTKVTPEHGEELNALQVFHRSLPPESQKQLDRTRGSDGKEFSLKMRSLDKWTQDSSLRTISSDSDFLSRTHNLYSKLKNASYKITPQDRAEYEALATYFSSLSSEAQKILGANTSSPSSNKAISLKLMSLDKWIWDTKTCGERLKHYADSAISPITKHPLKTISSVAIGALTYFYTGGIGYPALTGLASYLGSSYLPTPTAPLRHPTPTSKPSQLTVPAQTPKAPRLMEPVPTSRASRFIEPSPTVISESKSSRFANPAPFRLPPRTSYFNSSPNMASSSTRGVLGNIALKATSYPFRGYAVPGVSDYRHAASYNAVPAIKEGKMKLTQSVTVPGIGGISNCYTWKSAPSIHATVPPGIKNATVRLPQHVSATQFDAMRRTAQAAVVSRNGVSPEVAQQLALGLGGIVIEATLPYRAGTLLRDKGPDEEIHCIFQTGLNFAGTGGGGIPLTNISSAASKVRPFSLENAKAAVTSALANKSDVLIFNLGIGTGFFGGSYGSCVRQANVDGICSAVTAARRNGSQMEIIVPDAGLSENQKAQLRNHGIHIINADKDAVAALCARQTLRVSETIAGDPMSMLGIHGPGFWWETVGSASDEERAAFLSPSYALGHIPIDVLEVGKPPKKIAAISEYMR